MQIIIKLFDVPTTYYSHNVLVHLLFTVPVDFYAEELEAASHIMSGSFLLSFPLSEKKEETVEESSHLIDHLSLARHYHKNLIISAL